MSTLDFVPAATGRSESPHGGTRGTVAHKFGGSSLADAARFRHVARLLRERDDAMQVTVVSAMKGVTDALIALAHRAPLGEWPQGWSSLRAQHLACASQLLGETDEALVWLDAKFNELAELLRALSLFRSAPDEVVETIQGLGEVWSARILSSLLQCAMIDAREMLVVQRRGNASVTVDWEASGANLAAWRSAHPVKRVVVTGFIARDAQGRPTILGRNGSDYSAAIFAALFGAEELHIWTDVDGVMSADPRLVPEAVPLGSLSYHEACELAYFGAKVVHPLTMTPAMSRGIPITIRNTFKPEHPGTRIAASTVQTEPVKGITLSSGLALVNLEGNGMIGVPGTAERVFRALGARGVSVVMISQGSSEHSICCVVPDSSASLAQHAIEEEFARELASGEVQSVQISSPVSVLAAVGDGMAGTPGIAAQLFGSLARAGVNVRAIAQGSSERNISVAISSDDAAKGLRAAHAGFWLSPQTISLGVIGPGRVGSALLDQISSAMPRLRRESNLDLRLRAVAGSRRMILSDEGARDWRGEIHSGGIDTDVARLAHHLKEPHLPHTVIVDCSASDEVASHYGEWLAAGIHVITPNKHAGAGPLARYRAIREASTRGRSRFRYEATVGAGLPVIQTLRDLLDTGDELRAVDGIFSGTMAWLFNRYDGSVPFSQLVAEARERGYTEPDPREDLSGVDVARKLVILAREAGHDLELGDVDVESLVPESMRASSPEEFTERLREVDDRMLRRFRQASKSRHVLRYVAHLGSDCARVSLCELSREHAFAHLRSTDNIVQFTTRRYAENPLVVQGPGAGPEVTAAGVFADLLRVAAALGANV